MRPACHVHGEIGLDHDWVVGGSSINAVAISAGQRRRGRRRDIRRDWRNHCTPCYIFLTSVGKYQKEFNDSYSKLEKTRLDRNDQGRIERVDDRTVVNRAGWWSVPIILMIIGSMNVLGSIISS